MLEVSSGPYWRTADQVFYRYTPESATYDPAAPWWGTGRFDIPESKSLYVAETARGAIAEYFRRHPELLDFQDSMVVPLWRIRVNVNEDSIDVRTPAAQAAVGISLSELTSSLSDEEERYRQCRGLARLVVDAGLVGIAYPSAAATWAGAWNLVLFGEGGGRGWLADSEGLEGVPRLVPADVRPLVYST